MLGMVGVLTSQHDVDFDVNPLVYSICTMYTHTYKTGGVQKQLIIKIQIIVLYYLPVMAI